MAFPRTARHGGYSLRNGQSDAQYIKALETANKTINTENARLQKLLIKYQDIVRTGLKAIMFDIENCKSL